MCMFQLCVSNIEEVVWDHCSGCSLATAELLSIDLQEGSSKMSRWHLFWIPQHSPKLCLFQKKKKRAWQIVEDISDDIRKKLQGLAVVWEDFCDGSSNMPGWPRLWPSKSSTKLFFLVSFCRPEQIFSSGDQLEIDKGFIDLGLGSFS